MDKFKMSQILKLSLIAALLVITPLLSKSLRPTYLYFIVNLLIVALGTEAGLLSFFSNAAEDKEVSPKSITSSSEAACAKDGSDGGNNNNAAAAAATSKIVNSEIAQTKAKVMEKCSSEKIVAAVKVHNNVKKCPSAPSIFFIGGNDQNEAQELFENDGDGGEIGVLSGQELFAKAETFIGNFYKQLKMQREESWKKIHGLYHKAF